jgi:copper oxidase (laccase) domain-containing protein
VAAAATEVAGCIDVAAGVRAELAGVGVEAEQCPGCTAESEALFSFRRDGRTGRQGVIIRL